MAGARATAAILAGLPVLSALMGELIGARPVAFLLGGRLGGCVAGHRVGAGLRWVAVGGPHHRSGGGVMSPTVAMLLAAALLSGARPSMRAGPCRDGGPHAASVAASGARP